MDKLYLRVRTIALQLVSLVLLFFVTHDLSAQKRDLFGGAQWVDARNDTCYTSGKDENTRVFRSQFWKEVGRQGGRMTSEQEKEFSNIQTATIILEFGDGFGLLGDDAQAARDAFRFAADIWETEVVSNVPIIISADFAELPGGVLGQNGSPSVTNVPNAPDPSTNYTLALANAIAGFDLSPGTPNGNQTYNTNFSWYFGTDGNTPSGVTDFVTVVLHEIGHSMGISGISNGGAGVGANAGANPRSWDLLVELGDGTPILDLGYGTPEQQDALVSGDLFINGPLAVAALGGTRPQIWAPNPFQGGSSFSHWDENAFPAGDINSLMTPFVGSGESNLDIGPITRGVLSDQGWQLSNELAAQDVGVFTINAPGSDSDLGNAEIIEVTVRNYGIEDAENFDVSYQIDGGDVITETYTEVLPAVSTASFSFATPADLSNDGTSYSISAFTSLTGDEDLDNDATSATVSNLVPTGELAASEINFGVLGIGNELTKTVDLASLDNDPLAGEVDVISIDIVTSTSGSFVSNDLLPLTIAPGTSTGLSFTYSPAAIEADAAVATISTNAGDFVVQLIGQGEEPSEIAVDPGELSTVLEVGQTDVQQLTITNNGAADLIYDLSFGAVEAVDENASVAAPFAGHASLKRGNAPYQRTRNKSALKSSSETLSNEIAENSTYILDDGTGENNIGINEPNELMWLNAFQTRAGAEVITSISSAVASGPEETPARFILYDDPDNDGDPTNAVYLTETSGVLTNPGEDVFTTVNIDPTTVSGVFFVAVLIEEDPAVNAFPMPQDNDSGSQQSSWAISNSVVGEFDVFDLGNNDLPPLLIDDADASLAGNWLLRANGQFFTAAPLAGSISAGESQVVDVTFIGSSPGTVTSSIVISNNDPLNSEVVVPVTMEVEGVAVTATPSSFNVTLDQGRTATETLTLTNDGASDVTFSIAVNDFGLLPPDMNSNRGHNPVNRRNTPYSGELYEGTKAISAEGFESLGTVQYETSFEDFLTGDINGQSGWLGQFGNWTVNPDNPSDGSLHFRGLSDGLGQTLALSPEVAIGADPISSVSMDLAFDGQNVTWDIIPQSPTAESVVTRLRFEPDGSVSTLINGSGGAEFVPVVSSYPSGYFNVRIEAVRETSEFTIYFNNEIVFEGQGFAGDIEQLAVLSLMEVFGPTMDMDNLKIIDGSSDDGPPAISPNVLTGVIPGNGSVDIDLLFDADRDFGTYASDFVISLNDNPAIPPLTVDATLNVIGDPTIAVDPTVVQEVSDYNTPTTRVVTISNTGGNPLEYDLSLIGADIGVTTEEMNSRIAAFNKSQDRILDARVQEKLDRDRSASRIGVEKESGPVFITVGDAFFSEDFEGAVFPPAGWSTVDNEGSGVEWGFAADVGEGNYTGSGEAASVSSDVFGPAEFDTELISPVINVEGKSNLSLKFNLNYQNLLGLDFLDVDISTDGGISWTTLQSWNEDVGAFRSLPGAAISLPLDEIIGGASEVVFRWRYYDPNTGDWDWYAQIDDVEVVANTEVWVAANKSSGIVPVGGSEEIELSFDPTVVDQGLYVAGMIVNSNAENTPTVGVVISMEELDPAVIAVTPESLEEELVAGRTGTQTLTIQNSGESTLNFGIKEKFENVGDVTNGIISSDFKNTKKSGTAFNTMGSNAIRLDGAGTVLPIESALEDPVDFSTVLYATDFEAFASGDILGQNGWFGQFVNWVVSSENPKSGDQHIRSVSDGLGQTIALSPSVPIGTEPISSLSMNINLEGGGVTWQIIPQSPTSGSVVTRLSFNADGTVTALVADNGGEFQLINAAVPEGYFEVNIEVERATNIFTVYFDDEPVFTGEGFAGDVEQLVLLSLMEVFGPTLDIDNVQLNDGVVPDPVISTSPVMGSIPGGGTLDVEVTFNATNLLGGVYEDQLEISNNDPENPLVIVPTTLTVIDPQLIAVTPEALTAEVSQGEQTSRTLTITNEGVADLNYDITVVGDFVIPDGAVLDVPSTRDDWKLDPERVEKKRLDDENSPAVENNLASAARTASVAIVFEDFEGGTFPPAGWSVIDNESSGVVWGFAADTGDGNYAGTGEAATVNSDAAGVAEFDTELWTPEVEVNGRTGIVLEYVVNYQNLSGLDFLDLDISTDGGTSWTTMLSWNEDHGGFFSLPGETVSIELDEYIGDAETFIVRWRYYDPNTGDWDWYAQVDNVVIGVPWLSVANGAGTISGGESAEVEVQFDAGSLDPGVFNTNLVVHSDDLRNPEVTVPASLTVLSPPAISIDPEVISLSLFEGFSEEASFHIGNSGQTTLDYTITGKPDYVSVLAGDEGSVMMGENSTVELIVSAENLAPGNYIEYVEIESNDPSSPTWVEVNLTVEEFVILDLELSSVCSDNPEEERRWEVNNPNTFDVGAFWFLVGAGVGNEIVLAPGLNYFTSPTQTDRPNIVKLQWDDEDGVQQEGEVESTGQPCTIQELNLTSVCSNNPDLFRRWRVRNPNEFGVQVFWNVVGTSQSGSLMAAGDSDTFYFTETVSGPNTTIISWVDENGDEQQKVKASGGEICDVDNSCAGGEVIAFEQGTKKNGRPISARRSNPDNAVGYPEMGDGFNFVSLGFGGSIDIRLNNIVVDQPGNDFVVVETSFRDAGGECSDYPETADVYVSLDGEEYIYVGNACKDTPFDIATAGLMEIEYVRIVDTTNPAASPFGGNADGFDVDGIACINGHFSQGGQFVMQAMENNVPDEENESDIITFPNPFSERIEVKMDVEEEGRYEMVVHDVFGMEIYRKTVKSTFGRVSAEFNTSAFADGTYLITITSEDREFRQTHTIIKK